MWSLTCDITVKLWLDAPFFQTFHVLLITHAGMPLTESAPAQYQRLFSHSQYLIFCEQAGATQEEIEKAARGASAHDFISALPNGYDSEVI
jgi:hypothetical protein